MTTSLRDVADRLGLLAGRQASNSVTEARRNLVLVVVFTTVFLSSLETTVVGMAMPVIGAELHGLSLYAWAFTAYTMATTVTVSFYGKLSDIYGRKPFYFVGLVLFMVGSAWCGQAHSMGSLIAARAFQGLGAGAMMSLPAVTLGDIFSPRDRARWMGVFSATFGLSCIVGPLLGGFITDALGWRWIFYLNLPIGAFILLAAHHGLPNVWTKRKARVDYSGSVLLAAGLVAVLSGLHLGRRALRLGLARHPRALRGLGPGAGPFLRQRATGGRAHHLARALRQPGLLGHLGRESLRGHGPLRDGDVRPTHSGRLIAPVILSYVAGSLIGGQLISHTGRYKVQAVVGAALAALGMYLLTRMGPATVQITIIRNMAIVGFGIGLVMPVISVAAQNAFPYRFLGMVNSTQQSVSLLGGAIASPSLGVVLNATFSAELPRRLPQQVLEALRGAGEAGAKLLTDPQAMVGSGAVQELRQILAPYGAQAAAFLAEFARATREALAAGMAHLFVLSCVFASAALAATLFLEQRKLHRAEAYYGSGVAEERGAEEPDVDAGCGR